MSAPLGNQFWKARSSHGQQPALANPKSLFEWARNPALIDRRLVVSG